MTTIAHLSDMHFGAADAEQLARLQEGLAEDAVDHILVTGDLTQSGRKVEFEAARAWFDKVGLPATAIPGNHDTPVINLIRRFFTPWSRFEDILGHKEEPVVAADDFVFAGLNSARRMRPSLDWSTGKLTEDQLTSLRDTMTGEERTRLVGFHHPVEEIEEAGKAGRAVVPKREDVLHAIRQSRVDIVMTGHVHWPRVRVKTHDDWSFIYSQAGTAVSTRLRGEPASFNTITLHANDEIEIGVHRWSEAGFADLTATRFGRGPKGWREMGA
jgi:3',5'-cyclic AMP phosphodiesterase CpdA